MPDPARIEEVREPMVRASILAPKEHIGQIMELCQERRGEHQGMHFLSAERVQVTYDLPLAEIVLDFFDQLKSRTRGYASLDYEPIGMKPSDMVKLDVLLAGDPVDALSMIVHRDKAYEAGRGLVERLRKRIPRQQYDVPIQAAVGREDHRPRDGQGLPQGRHRQVLRRRHLAQAQAARAPEGGQEADEAGRPHRGARRTPSWPSSSSTATRAGGGPGAPGASGPGIWSCGGFTPGGSFAWWSCLVGRRRVVRRRPGAGIGGSAGGTGTSGGGGSGVAVGVGSGVVVGSGVTVGSGVAVGSGDGSGVTVGSGEGVGVGVGPGPGPSGSPGGLDATGPSGAGGVTVLPDASVGRVGRSGAGTGADPEAGTVTTIGAGTVGVGAVMPPPVPGRLTPIGVGPLPGLAPWLVPVSNAPPRARSANWAARTSSYRRRAC